MAKAFAAMEGAKKDSSNPHFKSRYADLESVASAIKPALVENGLFFAQITHEQSGGVCVETVVHHSGGESMSFGKLFVPASKQDAQGYGSALTYARRYSLMTAFGICPEDDDGNAATANPPKADEQRKSVTINKDQLAKIQAEIDRTGTDPQAICKGYAVKAVAELSASQFADAMSVLRKRPNTIAASEEELNDQVPY
jgi:hypothetical protein